MLASSDNMSEQPSNEQQNPISAIGVNPSNAAANGPQLRSQSRTATNVALIPSTTASQATSSTNTAEPFRQNSGTTSNATGSTGASTSSVARQSVDRQLGPNASADKSSRKGKTGTKQKKSSNTDEQIEELNKKLELMNKKLELINRQRELDCAEREAQLQEDGRSVVDSLDVTNTEHSSAGAGSRTESAQPFFSSTQYFAASKFNNVVDFKGETSEDVDLWFQELYSLQDEMKVADAVFLRNFPQWIKNEELKRWWRQFSNEIKTLAAAHHELRTVCSDNTPPHLGYLRMTKRYQKFDERVDKYILVQRETLSRLTPRFTDQQLPLLLWPGLNLALKAEVKMRVGMTMQEFLEACRVAEAVVLAKQNRQQKKQRSDKDESAPQKWCENCRSKTHNTSDCWSKKKSTAEKKAVKRKTEKDTPETETDKKPKLACYICSGPHLASQCTNK